MITSEQITRARDMMGNPDDGFLQHDDCVRIAYAWLDAQRKTGQSCRATYPLKHLVERRGGQYVSREDVEVAAHLHPDIRGRYPHYNISARLTEPTVNRIRRIGEAFTQGCIASHCPGAYTYRE